MVLQEIILQNSHITDIITDQEEHSILREKSLI